MVGKKDLCPGMVLGQDIYNYGHEPIIKKGAILDEHAILKIKRLPMLRVRVEDEILNVQEVEPLGSFSQRIRRSPEFQKFEKDYEQEVTEFQGMLNNVIERNEPIDAELMYRQIVDLLKDTGNSINAFDMVQNLRSYDDSTYAHSINVGLLSNVLAGWLGMDEENKKMATLSGILHDIGKTMLPREIIQKPGKLTDEEYSQVQKHTEIGYGILRENALHSHICNAALMHHERYDGSGYPHGLEGNQIDYFARIVSIVDVYDAMTSRRVYRDAMCPFDVIDLYVREGLQKYESEFILVFLKRIAQSYINETVRLSDGRVGQIVYIDGQALSRPTILVGQLPVDLRKEKDVRIQEIL